jgi:hypothetical protein
MELLERYLQAVRGYLLGNRRDDIVKELGANILSQMEDKAAELGRPINQGEQVTILKQYGHPLVAAARYRRLPLQQLVGPTLFPLYWYALQAILFFVAAFHVMVAIVLSLSRGSVLEGVVGVWGSFWLSSLAAVGGLTIFFGLIEYFGGGKVPFAATFDPLELPKIKDPAPRRGNSLAELILGCLFLVGWPIFLHTSTMQIAKSLPFQLAPVWWRFELPMLLTVALGAASALAHLYRPQSPYLRATLRLASDVAGMITFYFFLGAREFIVPHQDVAGALSQAVNFGSHVLTVGQLVNYGVALGPGIALIVLFVDALTEVYRMFRLKRVLTVAGNQLNGIL